MHNRVRDCWPYVLVALSIAALGGALVGTLEQKQKTIYASGTIPWSGTPRFMTSALLSQAGHEIITPAKKASSDAQAKILKLQLQASRIQTQYQACQAQDFQTQFNKTSVEIIQASDDALKEAKLDKKEWDLNLETFDFVKRPPPPPAEKK